MNRKIRKLQFRKTSKIAIPFLIISSIIIVYLFFGTSLLAIKEIEIKKNKVGCADENQLKESTFLYGENFFLINTQNLTKNLLAKFICVKEINLSRSFPDKVRLEFIGREPAASVINLQKNEASISAFITNVATPSAEQIKEAYLVDNEGIVFAKLESELNIPKIYADDLSFKERSLKNDLLTDCLKILDKARTFGLDVRDTWIKDDVFLINPSAGGPKIIFRLDNTIDIQIASLQLILQKAKIDESRLELIDLRFDKPVVRFAPKKIVYGER